MPRQLSFVEITQTANYPLPWLQDRATLYVCIEGIYLAVCQCRPRNIQSFEFGHDSLWTRIQVCEQLYLELSVRFPFMVATTDVLVSGATGTTPGSSLSIALAFIRFIDTSTQRR